MYELEDLKGEPIVGKFYEQELQITTVPDFKIIDKVIPRKKEGNVKMVYVSYDGWGEKFNEWITETEYVQISTSCFIAQLQYTNMNK